MEAAAAHKNVLDWMNNARKKEQRKWHATQK
jgi:hypothetical protein